MGSSRRSSTTATCFGSTSSLTTASTTLSARGGTFEPALGGPDAPALPRRLVLRRHDRSGLAGRARPARGRRGRRRSPLRRCGRQWPTSMPSTPRSIRISPPTTTGRSGGDRDPATSFRAAVGQRPATLGTGVAHGEFLLQLGPVGLCRYEVTTSAPDSGGEISEVGLGVTVVADRQGPLDGVVRRSGSRSGGRPHPRARRPTSAGRRTDQPGRSLRPPPPRAVGRRRRGGDRNAGRSHRRLGPPPTDRSVCAWKTPCAYVTTQWDTDGELVAREEFDSLHDAQTHLDTRELRIDRSRGVARNRHRRVGTSHPPARLGERRSAAGAGVPRHVRPVPPERRTGHRGAAARLVRRRCRPVAFTRADRHRAARSLRTSGSSSTRPTTTSTTPASSFESGGAALITVRDGLLTSGARRDDDKLPELLDELDRLTAETGEPVAYLSETARALRGGRRSTSEP